jgi:hypothetical protein
LDADGSLGNADMYTEEIQKMWKYKSW